MTDGAGNWITYNGEIYNYLELRDELGVEQLPHRLRHRGHPARLPHVGRRTALDAPARHVRLRALGRAEQTALLRPRPLRHQAVLLRASSTTSSTSPPRSRRCCRSCRRSRPTSRRFKDYLAFQFCLGGKTLFKGIRELLPGHFLRVARRHGRDAALLGGLLRPRLRAHEQLLRGADRASCSHESVDAAPAQRRAGRRVPQRRPRLEHRRVARQRDAQPDELDRLHRQVLVGAGVRRERATRATLADAARLRRSHEVDIGAARLRREHPRASSTTSTTRSPGPARSRSTWSRELAAQQRKVVLGGQGGDEIFGGYARYLIAYFEQCIKARDRRHDAQRQLRRHLRVDHPEPRRAARATSRCCRSSGARGSSSDLDARYFRLINRAPDLGDEIDWDALGDYSPFETFRDDLQRRERRQGVLLRQDDPLRLQDAAAGAAAGRGPRQHGARPRVARAAARPPAGRARGHDPGRRQVQGRRR